MDVSATAGASLLYMVNKNLHISLDYSYTDKKSSVDGPGSDLDFKRNIIGLTTKIQF